MNRLDRHFIYAAFGGTTAGLLWTLGGMSFLAAVLIGLVPAAILAMVS